MGRLVELTGQRFGRLLVVRREGSIKGKATWKCLCDCGKEVIVRGESLRRGDTLSCGCLHTEIIKQVCTVHGQSKTRIHKTWRGLFQRCENPHSSHYDRYGGRGIRICEEWKGEHGFIHFYEWAIKNGYSDNLTIDRIDNNKGYSPDNCRWVLHIDNCHNRNARKDSTTGYPGVQERVMRTGYIKYRASITANGERFNLGHFDTLEEAIRARKEAEKKYWNRSK